MRLQMNTVLVLMAVFSTPDSSRADDWPRWRGPEGTGLSSEAWKPETLARPKMLFHVQVGEGVCSLSVVAGRLYTLGNQGGQDVVSCLDAKTGKSLWRQVYRCPVGNFWGPRAT